jgi:hypothetical protein
VLAAGAVLTMAVVTTVVQAAPIVVRLQNATYLGDAFATAGGCSDSQSTADLVPVKAVRGCSGSGADATATADLGETLRDLSEKANGEAVIAGGYSASATLRFFVEELSPDPQHAPATLPVHIKYKISAVAFLGSLTGPSMTTASALLQLSDFGTPLLSDQKTAACGSQNLGDGPEGPFVALCTPTQGVATVDTIVDLRPDVVFEALAITRADGSVFGGGDYTAFVDPHIFVDPSFPGADQYTLLVSPNLLAAPPSATVPDPSSLDLMVIGVVSLVGADSSADGGGVSADRGGGPLPARGESRQFADSLSRRA